METKLLALLGLVLCWFMNRMSQELRDINKTLISMRVDQATSTKEVAEARMDIREATAKHTLPSRGTPPSLPKVNP